MGADLLEIQPCKQWNRGRWYLLTIVLVCVEPTEEMAFEDAVSNSSCILLVNSDVVHSNILGDTKHPMVQEVAYKRDGLRSVYFDLLHVQWMPMRRLYLLFCNKPNFFLFGSKSMAKRFTMFTKADLSQIRPCTIRCRPNGRSSEIRLLTQCLARSERSSLMAIPQSSRKRMSFWARSLIP